jgi:hypothetical protein
MRNRSLVAAAALLLSAVSASAGPFQWAWSMNVASLSSTNTLFAVDATDPTKGYTFRFDPTYSDDPGPIVSPTFPTTATIGVTTFRYWYQDGYPYNWVPTPTPADPNAGKFKVTINAAELTSGDTASQDFVGTLSYRVGPNGDVIPEVSWDVSRVAWDLGEYKFDVRMETPYYAPLHWRSVSSEWIFTSLNAPPESGEEPGNGGGGTPAETPEPGTMLLGGVALAGGVGAWLRKRKAA